MGLETDFFVASEEELQAAFPTWVPPSAKQKADKTWAPSSPFPKANKSPKALFKAQTAAVQQLPHAQFKRIDPVKLGTLQGILAGGKHLLGTEDRPALLCRPEEADEWMLVLTGTLVKALAKLTKPLLKTAAKRWSQTEELQMEAWTAKDAASVIAALSDLAKQATSENKRLYLWMRL